jgi:hypothetical protein
MARTTASRGEGSIKRRAGLTTLLVPIAVAKRSIDGGLDLEHRVAIGRQGHYPPANDRCS